jgi:hypothetical protein
MWQINRRVTKFETTSCLLIKAYSACLWDLLTRVHISGDIVSLKIENKNGLSGMVSGSSSSLPSAGSEAWS